MFIVLFFVKGHSYIELYDCTLVIVCVAIIGGRKYCYYCGERALGIPLVHLVTINLSLMGPDYGYHFIAFQEVLSQIKAKVIRTATCIIWPEASLTLSIGTLDWV